MVRKMIIAVLCMLGLAVIAVVGTAIFVVETEKAQFQANAALAHYEAPTGPSPNTAVIYFSRSGNTELMALEIAKTYRADVIHLEARDYRIGLMGWINALKDARSNQAVITPEQVDLSQYETIFIGSPIWLYSPAPPIWQFVSANDFTGKTVVLFNTFNSKFEQRFIDDLAGDVETRGGTFEGHIWVKRGRMTQQIDSLQLLDQVRRQLGRLANY